MEQNPTDKEILLDGNRNSCFEKVCKQGLSIPVYTAYWILQISQVKKSIAQNS
jgi:hypothetical protein